MAGIYLHIPFCKQACTYCDFHFSTSRKLEARLLQALEKEIELRNAFFAPGTPIRTVYFGGGTPSLIGAPAIQRLREALAARFDLSAVTETTLEANPDDLTDAFLEQLAATPVNRLSIGIQSFLERELCWMNRAHTAADALECVPRARRQGFENISIDLIYATPFLSLAEWEQTLEQAVSLAPEHISAYALTVEPRTALQHAVSKGQLPAPLEENFGPQFELLIDKLASAGYEQYEVSNFARPGFRSRHNSSYWEGSPYLGLGPSAHGFKDLRRYRNVPNNAKYLDALEAGQLPEDFSETLSPLDRFNELIMTRLRMSDGLAHHTLEVFKPDINAQAFEEAVNQLKTLGWLVEHAGILRLSRKGLHFADEAAARLFQVE